MRFKKVLSNKNVSQCNHRLIYELGMEMVYCYSDYIDEYVMHEAIKWCEKNKLPYTLEEIDENRVNMLDDKEKQQILKFTKDSNIL